MQIQKLLLIGVILSTGEMLQAFDEQKHVSVRRVGLVDIEESREDDMAGPVVWRREDQIPLCHFAQDEIIRELRIAQQIGSDVVADAIKNQGENIADAIMADKWAEACLMDKASMTKFFKKSITEHVRLNRVSIKSALGL